MGENIERKGTNIFDRCQGLTDQGMTELAAQLSNNGLNQLEILSLDFRK